MSDGRGAPLRLVFLGTPDFAVPTLRQLLASRHAVVSVVSQPDRRRGRGRRASPSPIAEVALAEGVPLLRPERVGAPEVREALLEARPDLGVVVAFGQFLPRSIRELPRLGYMINAHASLLPRWRGAAPIQHALLAGDPTTGISVMRVEREMDAGAVARVVACEIEADDDAGSLGAKLAALAADAIVATVDAIATGSVEWREQDHARATLAPRIERDDARLDWRESAELLARRIRAMSPRPGAVTELAGEPLRILAAQVDPAICGVAPGTVQRDVQGAPLRIATGHGWLVPQRLQRAGGRPLDVAEFLRGRDIADGSVLGVTSEREASLGDDGTRP